MPPSPPPRLPALTSLRVFAAAAVILCHLHGSFGVPDDVTRGKRIPLFLGVDFFLVLSGFILTYVYPDLPTWAARGRFLLARFARMWPGHAFALLVCLAVGLLDLRRIAADGLWPRLAANVLMVHSWFPHPRYGSSEFVGNGVSWSVATEFAFYCLFPLLIAGFRRTWPVKLLASALLVAGLVALCDRNGYPLHSADGPSANSVLHCHPLARLFEFVLGMATAHLVRVVRPRVRLGPAAGTALEVAALALLGVNLYYARSLGEWAVGAFGLAPATVVWFDTAGAGCVGFAVLIAVMSLGAGRVSRSLAWPPLVLLGELSFAVYVLHHVLYEYVLLHPQPFRGVPDWAMFVGYWAVLLAMSHLTWTVVEKPARAFLLGLCAKRSAEAAAEPKPAGRRWSRPSFRPTPARAVVAAELLTIGLFAYACERRPYRVLSEPAAAALEGRSLPGARDVRFGDRFVLRGAVCTPTHKGLKVELVWEGCGPQPLDSVVVVSLSDGGERVMCGAHYYQDRRRRDVAAGTVWVETLLIPLERVVYARHHGMTNLAVTVTALDVLAPDRGPTDPARRALLVSLTDGDRAEAGRGP